MNKCSESDTSMSTATETVQTDSRASLTSWVDIQGVDLHKHSSNRVWHGLSSALHRVLGLNTMNHLDSVTHNFQSCQEPLKPNEMSKNGLPAAVKEDQAHEKPM